MYTSTIIGVTHLYTYNLDLWPYDLEYVISSPPNYSKCLSFGLDLFSGSVSEFTRLPCDFSHPDLENLYQFVSQVS